MINLKEHIQFIEMIPGNSEVKDFNVNACVLNFDFRNIPGIKRKKDIVLVKVEGNNMEPTIFAGDVIICQKENIFVFKSKKSAAVVISRMGIKITRLYKHVCNHFFWLKNDNPSCGIHEEIKKDGILKLLVVYSKMNPVFIRKYSEERISKLENSLDFLKNETTKIKRDFTELKNNS